jgi:hypothetical protein|tara:strand:+ start:2489 stop:3394 length:906 start_codon:yes stop_codon:yes gene_type:complete
MAATEAQQETEVENNEIPLDVSEETVEIEIKSDDAAELKEETTAEEPSQTEQEQEQYGKSVQKRINKLTKRVKDTEREREEAVRYAQSMKSEAEKMKSRLQTLDESYITEYGSRITAEQSQAEAALKNAVETGDSQATVEAQRKLTQLAVAEDRYNQAKTQQEQQQKAASEALTQAPQQEVQKAPPDPKAENWASKNSWFGSDYTMTFAAFGIHKKLVEEEGFDPKSDSYYDELDKRIKSEFSHKFDEGKNETSKKTAQTVAGVSRGSKAGRNKVRLTPSQVAIAKKLGVPLEEYAKHVKG